MPSTADLVRQLRSPRRVEQLRAAERVAGLTATRPSSHQQLADAGAIPPLVALLSARTLGLQAYVTTALYMLAASSIFRSQIVEAAERSCAIPALVGILSSRGGGQRQHQAHTGTAGLLHRLTGRPGCLPALLAAGAVPALRRLWADCRAEGAVAALAAGSATDLEVLEESVLGALCALASRPASCAAVADADPIPPLARALQLWAQHGGGSGAGGGGAAADGTGSGDGSSFGIGADGLPVLPFSVAEAAGGLAAVVEMRRELATEATDAGAAEALVRLLGCACGQLARMHAMSALSALAGARAAARAVVAAGGFAAFVCGLSSTAGGSGGSGGSLNPCDAAIHASAALGIIQCITASPELRTSATLAGVVPALQRLASDGPDVAKTVAADILASIATASQPAPESSGAPAAAAAAAASSSSPARRHRAPRVCAAPGCGATTGLRFCGGCATVRYCGEACSGAHWREHRAECRRLQAEQRAADEGEDGEAAAAAGTV